MNRIIGIDYGDKNIGMALSCPLRITAYGLETIRRDSPESFKKPILAIREVIRENKVDTIVLGYPRNMDGTKSERSLKTEAFQERLQRNFKSLNIVLWDERLSSLSSERAMARMGVGTRRAKEVVDEAAAVYILQGYLDYLNQSK